MLTSKGVFGLLTAIASAIVATLFAALSVALIWQAAKFSMVPANAPGLPHNLPTIISRCWLLGIIAIVGCLTNCFGLYICFRRDRFVLAFCLLLISIAATYLAAVLGNPFKG
jgi:hypothetical protein